MRIAVIGAGTIGAAVSKLADEYGHTVTALSDSTTSIVDEEGIDVESVLERKSTDGAVGGEDAAEALHAPYDVLVEATPTTLEDAEPGYSHTREALERDRHVVLANKGPIALRYSEVRELERTSDGSVRFGATIGGALPTISTIEDHGPSRITSVFGALDGTANFILSRMAVEGLDFNHVLAEAQDLGVAKTDPSFEVDGIDSALKGLILANVLNPDTQNSLDNVAITGVRGLSGSMLDLAKEDGMTIRLITEVVDGEVWVGPRLISRNSTLAPTGNSIVVQLGTVHAGDLNTSGVGMGAMETASLVLSDVDKLAV